ncbi:hypothetical protein [Streptomyces sp. NPDC004685]
MCLFGITEQTAMRNVTVAHPERTAKLPRYPEHASQQPLLRSGVRKPCGGS